MRPLQAKRKGAARTISLPGSPVGLFGFTLRYGHRRRPCRGHPGIQIQLESHTDARSSDSFNLDLSQRRAKSAVNYIVRKGIASDRIVAKGYGESQLVNHCANGVNCSESEHQENRRSEFIVVKNLIKNE